MTPRQDHRSGYICRCAECRGHKPPARDPLVGDLFAGTDDAPVVAPAPAEQIELLKHEDVQP